eukprot:4161729-Amphidinium_carterae.1
MLHVFTHAKETRKSIRDEELREWEIRTGSVTVPGADSKFHAYHTHTGCKGLIPQKRAITRPPTTTTAHQI